MRSHSPTRRRRNGGFFWERDCRAPAGSRIRRCSCVLVGDIRGSAKAARPLRARACFLLLSRRRVPLSGCLHVASRQVVSEPAGCDARNAARPWGRYTHLAKCSARAYHTPTDRRRGEKRLISTLRTGKLSNASDQG
ncbi:hypothetical protein MRX96_018221 [Rhipicephalus microplus]